MYNSSFIMFVVVHFFCDFSVNFYFCCHCNNKQHSSKCNTCRSTYTVSVYRKYRVHSYYYWLYYLTKIHECKQVLCMLILRC